MGADQGFDELAQGRIVAAGLIQKGRPLRDRQIQSRDGDGVGLIGGRAHTPRPSNRHLLLQVNIFMVYLSIGFRS